MKITLSDRLGNEKKSVEGESSVSLNWNEAYGFEDILTFEVAAKSFVEINLDAHIKASVIYTPSGVITYQIPVGYKTNAYHPDAFQSEEKVISVKCVDDEVLKTRRNIAMNGLDKRWSTGYFPHAEANIVTRDEPWFEGKNAIDGHKVADGHGAWPYQSWGGGLRDDLEFTLDFGREVIIDEVVIYLRADFVNDHDVNWESGIIELSNGKEIPIAMDNSGTGQIVKLDNETIRWFKLKNLKREVSAAFTALTQIEVFGIEA